MKTESMRKEQYSAPAVEAFDVECEGVFCVSQPGAGEDGEDGDSMS